MIKHKPITFFITAIALLLVNACKETTNNKVIDENYRRIYIGPVDSTCGTDDSDSYCHIYKESLNADYSTLYDEIERFEYEPGFMYELIVEEETLKTPMAHGKTTQLRLVEVVNRVPIQLPLKLSDTKWRLLSMNGERLSGTWETNLNISLTESQLTGWAACNKYWANMLQEEGKLNVTPMTHTLAECPWLAKELIYLESLQNVHGFKVIDRQLHLIGDGIELIFAPLDLNTYNHKIDNP